MGTTAYFSSGGKPLFELAVALTVGACLFVAMRLVFRFLSRKEGKGKGLGFYGYDDMCISVALLLDIAMAILTSLSVYYGYGNPKSDLTAEDNKKALLYFWGTQILYKAVMMCTKLSMLCMYARVFTLLKPWFLYSCYSLGGIILAYAFASIVATIFQCTPVSFAWDKSVPMGHCINMTAFWYANAIVSISTDLMIIVLPIYPVCKLQVPKRTKFLLLGVFLVGGIVILASILRMTTLNAGSKSKDPTKGTLSSTCWTTVEANVGIIGACLPMLRGLLVRCFPKLVGSSRNRYDSSETRTPRLSILPPGSTPLGLHNTFTHQTRRSYRDLSEHRYNFRGHTRSKTSSKDAILEAGICDIPLDRIEKKTELDITITDRDSTSDGSDGRDFRAN